MSEHVAIIKPDDRGRFHLRRFLGDHGDASFRVFVDADRTTLRLEVVDG